MEAIFSSPYYMRYILPGLTFVSLLIFIPILVLNPSLFEGWGVGEVTLVIVAVLTTGYLLDVTGAYGWSPTYRKARQRYLRDIAEVVYPPDSIGDENDVIFKANAVLARFWARCPEDYQDLIEEPRAKWVLALQSAFICVLSGCFWGGAIMVELGLLGIAVHNPWHLPVWAFFLLQAMLCVSSLALGRWLNRRGLYLAKLSDATAITLLTDRCYLLVDNYIPRPREGELAGADEGKQRNPI